MDGERIEMRTKPADPAHVVVGITRVRLFGSLEVETEEGRLGRRDLGGLKPKQVFEVLLLARGKPVSKDRLGDLLWGEDLPVNVAATLGTYVSVLRTRLGQTPRRAMDLIVSEYGSYRIRWEAIWTDLDEFDEILRRWKTPEPSAREPLERALALLRGELLEDEPYAPWVERDRDRYRDQHGELLRRLTLCLLLAAEFEGAITHAQHALSLEPMDESACQMLMVALYAAGRQQAAARAFDSCRKLLEEELGVEPLDATTRCLARIRRHESIDELVASLLAKEAPHRSWDTA